MDPLNLPAAKFKIKSSENKKLIFDIVRKKYVTLNPEEWVRQHILHFLINHKNYPLSLIAVEKEIRVNKLRKRFDILVFNKEGLAWLIIECKSPRLKIDQGAFDQIARYNLEIKADYIMLSNGLEHYSCQLDHENKKYIFLKELPAYSKM